MYTPKMAAAAAILLACAGAAGLAQASLGTLTVSYTLHSIPRRASNQLAVWIEDAKGTYVRTLFATDFMARRRGYRQRPQCCPEWVQASGLEGWSKAEIDAVSAATQAPGEISLSWDCRTTAGDPVPAGTYIYKVEGNIYYDRRVLWTGSIRVGASAGSSAATPQYLPDPSAAAEGTLVEDVRASFRPSGR
jgi:hypothetical protein